MAHFISINSSQGEPEVRNLPAFPESRELQQAASIEIYKQALELQSKNALDDARLCYQLLLRSPLIFQARSPSARKLKYLALKNIGNIEHQEKNYSSALQWWLLAVSIDSEDADLWRKIGG